LFVVYDTNQVDLNKSQEAIWKAMRQNTLIRFL